MKLYTVHTALNTIFHSISNSKNFVKVDSVLSIDVNILIAVEYFRKVWKANTWHCLCVTQLPGSVKSLKTELQILLPNLLDVSINIVSKTGNRMEVYI